MLEFLLILIAALAIGGLVYLATPGREGYGVAIALAAGLLGGTGGYWLGRAFVHQDVGQGIHGPLWLCACLAALVVSAAVSLAAVLPRRRADEALLARWRHPGGAER